MIKSFVMYNSYEKHINLLTPAQCGKLFFAIFAYVNRGEIQPLPKSLSIAFSFIKEGIDRDTLSYYEKCETNRVNGKKGGRPSTEKTQKSERLFSKPKKPYTKTKSKTKNRTSTKNNTLSSFCENETEEECEIFFKEIMNLFNKTCVSLPAIKALTNERKYKIRNGYNILNTVSYEEYFIKVENSSFLTGKTGVWRGAGFDWIMNPSNMTKILEGTYDNKKGQALTEVYLDNTDYTEEF